MSDPSNFVHICGVRYPVNWKPNITQCRIYGHIAGSFHPRNRQSPHLAGITIFPRRWRYRDKDGEVVIDEYPNRTPDYRKETLLHEIMHGIESELIQAGELKEESPEEYIEAMARELYVTLNRAGIWKMPRPSGQLKLPFLDLEFAGELNALMEKTDE